ncbi:MAG TPA: LytTR family DNA-binding domain-containing protein [Pseudonocardiaceae bacterium]
MSPDLLAARVTPRHSTLSDRGLRILAIDDDPVALAAIVRHLDRDPHVSWVDGVGDFSTAVRYLHQAAVDERSPDAVFLDVRIHGMDGLEIAWMLAQFANPPIVVFVTACTTSAVAAFELHAADYLLKPARPERLHEAVRRVMDHIADSAVHDTISTPPVDAALAGSAPEVVGELAGDAIQIKGAGAPQVIPLAELQRVEAQRDFARFHTTNGSFLVRAAMTALEQRWCPDRFVRIHRSHLVALDHIEQVHDDGVALSVVVGTNGSAAKLTVSRRYARFVRALLERRSIGS